MLGLLWSAGHSHADDPDSKPGNPVFLPLITTGDKAANSANLTPKPVKITQITAQGGRVDAFTYFIPYQADLLDDQFHVGQSSLNLIDSDIEFIISVAIQNQSTVVFYDHWEDGLEENLTSPAQLSTEIWGDNDRENGIPPGFSTDLLRPEDVVVLRNLVRVPRDPSEFFYDGGDTLTSTGGALAVSVTFWTERPPGPGSLLTDAWELYPTNHWGTDYVIPIGENLAGTGPNQRPAWEIVGLNVQAVLSGTTVQIDLNGDAVFDESVTLDQGEQYNHIGTPNGLGPDSTLVGARVQASAPVQVHLFAANPLAAYEARGFTPVPFNQWTDDYIIPRTTEGDVWLYNPHSSPLDVEVRTVSQTTTLSIPGNSTVKYPPLGLSGPTGMRFTSTDGRMFYGLVALDALDVRDWGYVLLPFNRLATQALIGLGLGNTREPPDGDESRIYVTANTDTTIFVDYNNLNDSDTIPDASFPVAALAEVAITDPADHDMTGAFLYTTDRVPFVAVWGQVETAPAADPSIDAGTGIVPLPALLLQKTYTLQEDKDCTGTITLNDVIEFRLNFFNNTANTVRNVVITDLLPPELTYVRGTTRLNGALLRDSATETPFLLDQAGFSVGDVLPLSNGVLTFEVTVVAEGNAITNRSQARSDDVLLASDLVVIFTTVAPTPPLLKFELDLLDPANGVVTGGQNITFGLTISSTSSSTITRMPAQITFEQQDLAFQTATLPPDDIGNDRIVWQDLTAASGPLLPGAAVTTLLNFQVNDISPETTSTTLEARSLNARLDGTRTQITCRSSADVDFGLTPAPGPSPSPPDDDDDDDDDPPESPSPPPSDPSGGGDNQPTAPPAVLPVTFLPETGFNEAPATPWGLRVGLLLLLLAGATVILKHLK